METRPKSSLIDDQLVRWLEPLDSLMLECDGLTRVISTLMQRDGIDHEVRVGQLHIPAFGTIPLHYWIAMPDGCICDFRARMWLGDHAEVPHGVFQPADEHDYSTSGVIPHVQIQLSELLFTILADMPMSKHPPFHDQPEHTTEGPEPC